MKMTFHKRLTAGLTAILMACSVNAFAVCADVPVSTVKYTGSETGGKVELSSDDFFAASKDMMPGDTSHQQVTFQNRGKADIRIYLRAEYVALGDEAQDAVARDMVFNQLDMKLTYPTTENGQVVTKTIYEGKLSGAVDKYGVSLTDTEQNSGRGYVLGRLSQNANMEMNVEITIPEELGNLYQNAVAKVKWIFIVEDLYDENIPNDDPPLDGPDTGVEQSMLWPIVGTIAAVSLLFMLWLAVPSKRLRMRQTGCRIRIRRHNRSYIAQGHPVSDVPVF